MEYIHTSEGRIRANETFAYDYYLKDHLGNTRVVFTEENNTAKELQVSNYYPFGMRFGQAQTLQTAEGTNQYLYNGKELQEDFNLDWYDYGARMYDGALGRFMSIDPLAEQFNSWTPYHYVHNSPINLIDPDGRSATNPSTHTDEDGYVIAVYDDGDNGVYKHEGKEEEAEKNVKKNYSEDNTSSGGEEMGESLHSLSFANQGLYNETGEVKNAKIKIDFESTELTEDVQAILDADPSAKEYFNKAGAGKVWDIKAQRSIGSKLFGKYASPRDAGNFAAGAVAQASGAAAIYQHGYGTYNASGNSKWKMAAMNYGFLIAGPLGWAGGALTGHFGEDKLSQRSINIGKSYIKNK